MEIKRVWVKGERNNLGFSSQNKTFHFDQIHSRVSDTKYDGNENQREGVQEWPHIVPPFLYLPDC